jgi:hypothetical protein
VQQCFKQHNWGAALPLVAEDLLIARGTPRFVSGVLRHVRMRIARDGFAERSIHDMAPKWSSFWHYRTELPTGRLDGLMEALRVARAELADVVGGDPNGVYRKVEYWDGTEPVALLMEYEGGTTRYAAPRFEAAWEMIVRLYPPEPALT